MKKRFFHIGAALLTALVLAVCLLGFFKLREYAVVRSLLRRYDLSAKAEVSSVLTVGFRKDFPTLQSAVVAAENGSVIVVFSGTYTESVHATDKTLYILGQSREKCVLTFPNSNYFAPPIEMGSGMLANMTVHATHGELAEGAIAPAYALHTDFDISENTTLDVLDVDFINDSYQTVGIGLRDHFTLRFRNCLFQCNGDRNAFYCHDDPTADESVEQNLVVERCRFVNNGANASTILLQSQEAPDSQIRCLWKHNTVENKGGGKGFDVFFWNSKTSDIPGWQNMSFWKNSPGSHSNDLAQLNDP